MDSPTGSAALDASEFNLLRRDLGGDVFLSATVGRSPRARGSLEVNGVHVGEIIAVRDGAV